MNLEFESTRGFIEDFEALPQEKRLRVTAHVNVMAQLFINDKGSFSKLARRLVNLTLDGDLKSSFYAFKVDDLRVMATFDNDPLFDRVLVTLLRVVPKEGSRDVYVQTAKVLYGSLLKEIGESESTPSDKGKKRSILKRLKPSTPAPQKVSVVASG